MQDPYQKWRILITGPHLAKEAMAILDENTLWQATGSYPQPDQILAAASKEKIDGIIILMGKIGIEALKASPNLRIGVKHGVGNDNIDVQAATQLGIPVCITPNANYHSVAEHALTMMFGLGHWPDDGKLSSALLDYISGESKHFRQTPHIHCFYSDCRCPSHLSRDSLDREARAEVAGEGGERPILKRSAEGTGEVSLDWKSPTIKSQGEKKWKE